MSVIKAVVHCSASEWGTAIIIDRWHRERKWSGIGYHDVLENGYPTHSHYKAGKRLRFKNGMVTTGRPYDADPDIEGAEVGAHVYGHNQNTIAVCLVGDRVFTKTQVINLIKLLRLYQHLFGIDTSGILGHYELDSKKTCPNLPMDVVRRLVANKNDASQLLNELKRSKAMKEV